MEKGKDKILTLHHWYQPPWQFPKVLDQIVNECYIPMSEFYRDVNNFKVGVNMNYSLTKQLMKQGHNQVISNLIEAAEKGNVEFLGSTAFHAFGPYTPKDEFVRQIELNEKGNKEIFGEVWKSEDERGFFPPEMGFNPQLAITIKEAGFAWTITSGIAMLQEKFPSNRIHTINGLPVFFRADDWSKAFAMDFPNASNFDTNQFAEVMGNNLFWWFLKRRNGLEEKFKKFGINLEELSDNHTVMGFDVETMGHHHKGYNKDYMFEFARAIENKGFESELFTSYLNSNVHLRRELINSEEDNERFMASWSTGKSDIYMGEPYPLWTPSNPINNLQHKLIELGIEAVNSAQTNGYNVPNARNLLDYAQNSCKFWWANQGYLWNPGLLMLGAAESMQVFYALEEELSKEDNDVKTYVSKAENMFQSIYSKIKERDSCYVQKVDGDLPDYFVRKDIYSIVA